MKKLALPLAMSLALIGTAQADSALNDVTQGIEFVEAPVQENDSKRWTLGFGVANLDWAYRDMDDDTALVPIVGYEGEKFFIRGTRVGYNLYRSGGYYFNVIGERGMHAFDSSDSGELRGLDDRHHSFNAGFHGGLRTANGNHLRLAVLTDVSKTHDGVYANLSYGHLFGSKAQGWTLTPEVGVRWYDDNYADYYFGVSSAEQARTGIQSYDAEGGIAPYLRLTATYNINEQLSLLANLQYTSLNDEIADSPMVEDENTLTSFVGMLYRF